MAKDGDRATETTVAVATGEQAPALPDPAESISDNGRRQRAAQDKPKGGKVRNPKATPEQKEQTEPSGGKPQRERQHKNKGRWRASSSAKQNDRQQIRRPAVSELPPDRQAEISAHRQHESAKRKHNHRPQLPSVEESIELHTNDVNLLYIRHFEPCNQYAIAIDAVARERLTDRAAFNTYLQEFDEAIETLTMTIRQLYAQFEEASSRSMATNKNPTAVSVSLQTRRSLQILRIFKSADEIVRMVHFLNIYDDLDDQAAKNAIDAVSLAIRRSVKAMRKVKLACFKRIVEIERLDLPVNDATSVQELSNAIRAVSRVVPVSKELAGKKVRRRSRKPVIDPASPAAAPIEGTEISTGQPVEADEKGAGQVIGEVAAE